MPSTETINPLRAINEEFQQIEKEIRLGGGLKAIERQHEKNRLTARERIDLLVDDPAGFTELGLWAAYGMYAEHGGAPGAGVVTGVGTVEGRTCMIIANDATVKAGAFFPMTCKKIIRAQNMAHMARMPLVYLVDSAGVYLPLQEDVFPDTDDFGRIFRNNAVISAEGIPQIAAIMGFCVAGGGYLPVLCDTLLMTEGSGLYLAGPALVKAAIGQEVSDEDLGGASMHAAISGTIDFKEKDDESCIKRVRSLVSKYPNRETDRRQSLAISRMLAYLTPNGAFTDEHRNYFVRAARKVLAAKDAPQEILDAKEEQVLLEYMHEELNVPAEMMATEADIQDPDRLLQIFKTFGGAGSSSKRASLKPARNPDDIYSIYPDKAGGQYDIRDILACIVDAKQEEHRSETGATKEADFDEYKAEYGAAIVCGYARIDGATVGIVANQKKVTQRVLGGQKHGGKDGPTYSVSMPGVIYDDSADKAARFIMDCNQRKIPIVFLHDTTGFMVGRDSEQQGIIRSGAKMVNAMSNCIVPKIVVILNASYGAGNYAMCGRAFDPFISLAWPGSKCAVMGAAQATGVLAMIEERSRQRKGESIDEDTKQAILKGVADSYNEQQDIRHGAARGWLDRIIEPHRTREELIAAIEMTQNWDYNREFKTGVLQV